MNVKNFFLQVPYTWYTTAANHKLNTIKKVKMKTQNILNFLFWNSLFPLYKNLCWNTFHKGSSEFSEHFTYFPLSKKINHSEITLFCCHLWLGFDPKVVAQQTIWVASAPQAFKLQTRQGMFAFNLLSTTRGCDSINFHKLFIDKWKKIYKIS